MGKRKIKIDPDLEEIVPGYLANRRKDIIKIRAGLEAGDFESIRVMGHSMKGTGSSYGFSEITDLGRDIETAAGEGQKNDLSKLTTDLENYLDEIEVVYEPSE